ncbi:MAG: DNA repair protein RadC [Alphaproteobacteria bacterium]
MPDHDPDAAPQPTAPFEERKAGKPHAHGHRQRLRERFLRDFGASMADYELLELLLTLALPRRDVKPIAKELIARFGSFACVVSADPVVLESVKDVKSSTVTALKLVQAAAQRLAQQQVMNAHVLSSWDKLIDYCRIAMAHEKVEQVRLLFLDHKNRLIADEVQQRGTVNHTPLYPREVMKRALELNASALILVHNHPSGDPTPSGDDIQMTYDIRDAAKKLGITLHDHLIISKGDHTSFKSSGLL